MEITWNYVKNGTPTKSGWYLVSYGNGVQATEAYWDKQKKKWLTRIVDEELTTVYAYAEMPKSAKKED